jgi:hypothetical protein
VPEPTLLAKIKDGTVNPKMERKEATALLNNEAPPKSAGKKGSYEATAEAPPKDGTARQRTNSRTQERRARIEVGTLSCFGRPRATLQC